MFTPSNDDKKLDWMYKGATSLIDREEYLLGKSIDKTLEQAQVAEKHAQKGSAQPPKNHVEHECIPPSIRDYKQQIGEQVDLAAKLQEDPLVAIRKREEEARKKFLQNPVQLKKIQKALKEKDKGKKKSSKKKKKKKRKSHSSEDSDNDLDAKLAAQLLKFKNSETHNEEDNLNAILALKFSAMKDKLSETDFQEIMEGKFDDSDFEQDHVKSSDEEEAQGNIKLKKKRHSSSDDERKSISKQNKRKFSQSPVRSFRDKSRGNVEEKREYAHKKRSNSEDSVCKERSQKHSKKSRRSRSTDRKSNKEQRNYKSEQKQKGKKHKNRSSSSEDSKKTSSKNKKNNKSKRRNRSDSSYSSDSSVDNAKRYKNKQPKETNRQTKHLPPIVKEPIIKYNSDSDEIVEERRNYGLVNADGSKLMKSTKPSAEGVALKIQKQEAEKVAYKPEQRKRLTEEEKEKLRKEMSDNAAWRCKDREKNLQKYREEDEKEIKERKNYDPDFLQKQLIKSTSSTTVESRIKSNINNIQRSSTSMNTNFSRK